VSFNKSTLEQREYFYKNRFDINKIKKFLLVKPQFFVIDLGTETGIIKKEAIMKIDGIPYSLVLL